MTYLRAVFLCFCCGFYAAESIAQEITPRLFWPAPKGTKVFVSGYSYLAGDVLIGASVPLEDVNAKINSGVLAYAQTLGLWGRTTNFLVEVPYMKGAVEGLLEGEPRRRELSAFGDIALSLNVNLKGAASMNRDEFMAFRQNPENIIGAGLKVFLPTGAYNSEKLINTGANRWAARLKLGSVFKLKPSWLLELSASTWLFGNNSDFLLGKKEQDPIYALEANLIRRIKPGMWASLDVTYYTGGEQIIDGQGLDNAYSNVKVGVTAVFPFHRRHALKVGLADGVVTRVGNDFSQFILSYNYVFH